MSDTQQHQQSPDEFLMGGGVRSAKFDTVGVVAKGTIVSLAMQQQRDYAKNTPKFWDDGKPMMQLRVVIQTDERDDADDDGLRALYLKGESQKAVREAVRSTGAKTIEAGGTLAVAYIGDGEAKGTLNPPKLYRAQYKPPSPVDRAVGVDDLI